MHFVEKFSGSLLSFNYAIAPQVDYQEVCKLQMDMAVIKEQLQQCAKLTEYEKLRGDMARAQNDMLKAIHDQTIKTNDSLTQIHRALWGVAMSAIVSVAVAVGTMIWQK